MKTIIPDIILERYLLKELPAQKMTEIARLVSEDPSLQSRLGATMLPNMSEDWSAGNSRRKNRLMAKRSAASQFLLWDRLR